MDILFAHMQQNKKGVEALHNCAMHQPRRIAMQGRALCVRNSETSVFIFVQFIIPFRAGFGTVAAIAGGCQRFEEPVLSPLLYKSNEPVEGHLTLQM